MPNNEQSFIEVQFPVSKVSKESYKERKAGSSQTLTGLGKWWGRKPLILVRSAILGLLMPASDNPKKDREIFLKILTMDDEGLWIRKDKSIDTKTIYENLTPSERKEYFKESEESVTARNEAVSKNEITSPSVRNDKKISPKARQDLQKLVFNRLSYDEKLKYCKRPEEIDTSLSPLLPEERVRVRREHWQTINNHLNTNASNLQELIAELGKRKFGVTPIVGDCFCGGGSIPFEAARIGCDVFASDLNPIAILLTYASLNINGSSDEEIKKLKEFQEKIYNLADKQITEWGIEHNEKGHRANAYLYCNETICPECGYKVPLAPSWVIGKGTKTISVLGNGNLTGGTKGGFDIQIKSNSTNEEMEHAEKSATIQDSSLLCPNCKMKTTMISLRKDRKNKDGTMEYGLRKWTAHEFLPQKDDVFQERLYCIRYEDENGKRYYKAPDEEDLKREKKVLELLTEQISSPFEGEDKGEGKNSLFHNWQEKGYIPNSKIEEGEKTYEPIRTRGWTYWHQLFNPRQLLIHGLLMELLDKEAKTEKEKIIGLLGVNKCCNWNSKLCGYVSDGSDKRKAAQTFYNQALNTLFDYITRPFISLDTTWLFNINNSPINSANTIKITDARQINHSCHIWITDPPYADAVNYHELSEFFLAWDKKMLQKIFPDWYTDSKRALAVTGTGQTFNNSMIDIYKNLAQNMPDDGMQIVMFTHQDVSVWAELSLILWSAGLRVTTAWNIATETESGGLKQGNYVKGTVLLVLRKQTSDQTAYLDELYPEIEAEVKRQIDSMRNLDDKEDPNFSDPDYLLAAYAASLKVLTSYKKIEDIDVNYELAKREIPLNPPSATHISSPFEGEDKGEGKRKKKVKERKEQKKESSIEKIINEAVKIAYDYLIPKGFDSFIWKTLIPEERFFIKCLDLEKSGIYQLSAYQELARGFGVKEYKDILASTKANQARLKTASELGTRGLSDTDKFGSSLLRNILVAIHQSIKEENAINGKNWLKNELSNYWNQRSAIIEILDYLATLEHIQNMDKWKQSAYYARILKELVKSDGV